MCESFGGAPLLASSALRGIPCLIGPTSILHAVVDASRSIDFSHISSKAVFVSFLV